MSAIAVFPARFHEIARLLITNRQGGPLAQMRVTPDQPLEYKILSRIVLHTASIFSSISEDPKGHFLLPFINMLTAPETLSVS